MGAAAVTFAQGRKVFCSNAEMKISFLAPVPPGATLTCTAQVVSGGSTVAFVEASIWAAGAEHRGRDAGGAADPGRATNADGAADEGGPEPTLGRLVARANSTYIFRPRD